VPRQRLGGVLWLLVGTVAPALASACEDLTLDLGASSTRAGAGGNSDDLDPPLQGGNGAEGSGAAAQPGSGGGDGSIDVSSGGDGVSGGVNAGAAGATGGDGGSLGGNGGSAAGAPGGDGGFGHGDGNGGHGGGASSTEPVAINEDWTRALDPYDPYLPEESDPERSWWDWFGDPWVDVANNRLVVSYDDIVRRKAGIEGGYYLRQPVTLVGNTAYTTSPHLEGLLLPSVRRNGDGIELGGMSYGDDYDSWSTTVPDEFAGAIIPDTIDAVVTLYVKMEYAEFAVKVEAGGMTYSSGWRETMFAPGTELTIVYMIGQNNSVGSGGSGDKIYIGPLTGYSNLSDSAVSAAYYE
jgi:hypothetical protein